MSNRETIFAAVRSAARPGLFNDPMNIHALDNLLDSFDVPRPNPRPQRRASPACIAFIHSFEALKLSTYPDPGSKNGLPITGGWGSTRDEKGKPFKLGFTAPKDYWDRLFLRDLQATEEAVNRLIGNSPTTQGQFDAMVSFAYNCGAEAFGGSTLLRKHKNGDYAGAAAAFAAWRLNDGKVMKGLVRRRAGEAAMYAS